jgi:hypothetical protein
MHNLKIGKLTLNELELESMSSREINRDLLLSSRTVASENANKGTTLIRIRLAICANE